MVDNVGCGNVGTLKIGYDAELRRHHQIYILCTSLCPEGHKRSSNILRAYAETELANISRNNFVSRSREQGSSS
jgi:hypothetical protein